MLKVTQDEAERIAYAWIREQENALDSYGGYPGELYVVRDMLVSFIRSEGSKYDGSRVEIMTVQEALDKTDDYIDEWEYDNDEEDEKDDWRNYEAIFGESVQSLAKYLMTAKGGPDTYNAGCPYKEDAPAVKNFIEKISKAA